MEKIKGVLHAFKSLRTGSGNNVVMSQSMMELSSDETKLKTVPYVEIIDIQLIDLPVMDINGFADPYINIRIGSETVKTSIAHKTLNASYSNCYLLKVNTEESKQSGFLSSVDSIKRFSKFIHRDARIKSLDKFLEMVVWDRDTFTADEYIGSAFFNLNSLTRERYVRVEEHLTGTHGRISFMIKAHNFGQMSLDIEHQMEEKMIGYHFHENNLDEMFRHSVNLPIEIDGDKLNLSLSVNERLSTNTALKVIGSKIANSRYKYYINEEDDLERTLLALGLTKELRETYLESLWALSLNLADHKLSEEEKREQKLNKIYDEVCIKIVVVDQEEGNLLKQNLRTLVAPVIYRLNVLRSCTIGLFHTGLIIGCHYFEWNDSSLCIPRSALSRKAFLSHTIDTICSLPELEETLDKVAERVVEWNLTKTYREAGGDRSIYGNCQEFVDTLLNTLGLSIDSNSAFGQFVDHLKKQGSSKLIFNMSKEFADYFRLIHEPIEFTTHLHLDIFVKELVRRNRNWHEFWSSEYELLKAFDRGFWLRYLKLMQLIADAEDKEENLQNEIKQNPKNEMIKQQILHMQEEKWQLTKLQDNVKPDGHCPFDHPIVTNEFIYNTQ